MRTDQLYATSGYVVLKGVVSDSIIDDYVSLYERDIRTSKQEWFRQSGEYQKNIFNKYGHVINSFLNPHKQDHMPLFSENGDPDGAFAKKTEELASCKDILDALTEIRLYGSHSLIQTMLFEQSIAPPHQDWVYLDSIPRGNLIAAWVALEDILDGAPKFYVIPGSQNYRRKFRADEIKSSYYMDEMAKYVETIKDQTVVPEMKKGDVLFWNSRLIHGSLKGEDESISRPSLAAHFIPQGHEVGFFMETPPDSPDSDYAY